jgi:hypothetical protein
VSSFVTLGSAVVLGLLLMMAAGCGHVPIASVSATVLPADILPMVARPMGCGEVRHVAVPVVKIKEKRYDFNGDGVRDTVVAVRCDTGAGNPPSAVFAVAATPAGPLVERLLDPREGGVVTQLRPAGADLSIVSMSYSADAPRCCPDLEVTYAFRWDGEHFAPESTTRRPI